MVSFTAIVSAIAAATLVAAAPIEERGSYSGQATYYYQNGNPGNCGSYNSDSAYIVALDSAMYNGGSHCGQSVKVTNTANGKSVTAKVADSCPTCASSGSLDLSEAAFKAIGSLSSGVLPITWSFE